MKNLLVILSLFAFVSCATTSKKSVEEDRESIGKIHSEKELFAKGREMLDNSKLTARQKKLFIDLYEGKRARALELEEQIREYRAVLFKTLVSKNYDQRKFDIASSKLKKVVIERYELSMKLFREGKKILGVSAVEIYDDPWFELIHKF